MILREPSRFITRAVQFGCNTNNAHGKSASVHRGTSIRRTDVSRAEDLNGCVLTSQQWLMNRAELPFIDESMTSSPSRANR